VVILSILAVALSAATVLLSVFALHGFQQTISQKVSELQGDYMIDDPANVEGAEWKALPDVQAHLIRRAVQQSGLDWMLEPVAQRACIAKSQGEVEGVMARGLSQQAILRLKSDADTTRLALYLSKSLATRLNVQEGDAVSLLFFESGKGRARARRYPVGGFLSQGLDEFDQHSVVVPLEALKTLMPEGHTVSRWELRAPAAVSTEEQERSVSLIQSELPPGLLRISSVETQNRALYDWLRVLDTNLWVMLVLMIAVAVIALSTTLLILMFEQTSLVGLLQALGAHKAAIQQVFWWQGLGIALAGLIMGNALAFGLAWAQNHFQWIQLDAEQYFIDAVVFSTSVSTALWVNVISLVLCMLLMLFPIRFVRKMSVSSALRYE